MIDWDKPVQTRDGREVRIYTKESRVYNYPVRGEVKAYHNEWHESSWNLEGMWSHDEHSREDDLVNVPQQHTVWFNVVKLDDGGFRSFIHDSYDEADEMATNLVHRIACFEHTFTEGEGLE